MLLGRASTLVLVLLAGGMALATGGGCERRQAAEAPPSSASQGLGRAPADSDGREYEAAEPSVADAPVAPRPEGDAKLVAQASEVPLPAPSPVAPAAAPAPSVARADATTPGSAKPKVRAPMGVTKKDGVNAVASGPVVAAASDNVAQVVSRLRVPTPMNTEAYDFLEEQGFLRATDTPLSTFSIDVDTASYSNVRRFLNQGSLPPTGAVRIEELVNYFAYDYPNPQGGAPFSVTTELSVAPWNPRHQLLRLGLRARKLSSEQIPARNLVFLIDVSGSMEDANKLPLLKQSFRTLTDSLREQDRVAMVVYAGASGVVLPPTSGRDKAKILGALDQLQAGGSTNGAQGLELAYRVATEQRRPGTVNRVLLATDGDFNVGITSRGELVRMVENYKNQGISLTTLGFGMGNYKDATMEQLADKGDGNYAYIDTLAEARRVLVEQGGGTLVTIAKDVKIQVEFNPAKVGAYRLIGYDNRRLQDQDFNDDRKDAGEIGSGHTVTALYELVPPGQEQNLPTVDPLRYGKNAGFHSTATQARQLAKGPGKDAEWMTIKLRYKQPEGGPSRLLTQHVSGEPTALDNASPDFRFTAAVAAFGLVLRDSQYRGTADLGMARRLAQGPTQLDRDGTRREFLGLVDGAARLMKP